MTEPSRRQFLGAAAALAAARWEEEGFDPENVEAWDEIEGGVFLVDEIEPEVPSATFRTGYVHAELIGVFDSTSIQVCYTDTGIYLDFEGKSSDPNLSFLTDLEPDQARALSAALFQAAWEFEQRPRGERQQ